MTYKMIVLMGGQGVGKGTHARRLISQNGYKYVEAGAILRSLPSESPVAQIMARGELVPDEELFKIIGAAIQKVGNVDMIVDGFPRTIGQAQWLVKQYATRYDVRIIYLNVPEKIMLERIENRIREGGGRADDADAAVVRRRLDNFFKTTMPAIEWLKTAQGITFSDVDVSAFDFETNYAKVCDALKKAKVR
ncbi:MAG: nucleoside monophosphate kinase [Alphaproteobacteria bacterium]|nr:nucleoside monophosphate kinase [Alphaproteobacteria bacterium]